MRLPLALLTPLALLSGLPALAQDPADFVGKWRGELDPLGLEVEVDLAHANAWSGDISIPAQGAEDLALRGITLADGALTFAIDGVPGEPTFVARLEEAALVGEFTQASFKATFRLERSTSRVPETLAALEGLDRWLDEMMESWKVPGVGLAIVRDGEVVRVSGHGLRDVAAGLPVTADTLFAIGSSSKAFTTTTLAALAGEGELDWSTPLVELLPGLVLHDEYATRHLTPRDMASHVSGLPRHDLAWYGREGFGQEEIFASLRHYEPTTELREQWQYNNLMYVTLGYLASHLDGRPWEEAVRARIFEPLGMARSNFSVVTSQADDDHALPYDERDEELSAIPFRDISGVGPAGSINSSARDMARWALLQLGGGEVDGVRVLPEANLTELHVPRAVVGGLPDDPELAPTLYGMGWMIDGYRGHLRLHHGGNIDGFSALVTFFPHDDLGVVVLTNRNATPVPEFVVRQVADRVLGHTPKDWSSKALAQVAAAESTLESGEAEAEERRVQGTSPAHAIADYSGAYEHPGYGTIEVAPDGEALSVTFHSLSGPLEHWHFETFRVTAEDNPLDGTMLRFETDLEGRVAALFAPVEPTLPPVRFERSADESLTDPEYLERFVGAYSLLGQRVEVTLTGSTLSITVPGQGAQPLVPKWDDTFGIEESEAVSFSFRVEDGAATALVIVQAGQTIVAERLEE